MDKEKREELLIKISRIERELRRIRGNIDFSIYKEDNEMIELFYGYICDINKRTKNNI